MRRSCIIPPDRMNNVVPCINLSVQRNLPNSLSRESIRRPLFCFLTVFTWPEEIQTPTSWCESQTPGRHRPPSPLDNHRDLTPITRYYSYIFHILFFPFRVPIPLPVVMDTFYVIKNIYFIIVWRAPRVLLLHLSIKYIIIFDSRIVLVRLTV